MSELRTIDLDPKVWLRDTRRGALLRLDDNGSRRQCCLGIAATAFGVEDDRLGPLDLAAVCDLPEALQLHRDVLTKLQTINDAYHCSDSDRVRKLNSVLADASASFRFALKENEL